MSKYVVWLLGGMSVGKTTQLGMLLDELSDDKPALKIGNIDGVPYMFTSHGFVSYLGKASKSSTWGLDTAYIKLKKEGIRLSVREALRSSIMVLIESQMSASTWFDLFEDAKVIMVLLKCSKDSNEERLIGRKILNGMVPVISEKNQILLEKKASQAMFIYNNFKVRCSSLVIETDERSPKDINMELLRHIYKSL